MMDQYRVKVSTPIKKEFFSQLTGQTEVSYTCSKCLSVMVEMKCLICAKKTKTKEEEAAMSEQMDALVKEYNELTGKQIKRFASVAIGQQRVEKARFQKENPTAPPPPAPEKPRKRRRAKSANENLSDGVRKSWTNEATAAQRGKRHSAQVEGHGTYKSVWQAFQAIGLPMGRVINFRKALKVEMKKTFEHDGKQYHFALVPRVKPTEGEEATS